MTIEEISKLSKVITINENSTNIIFINRYAISVDDASTLAEMLKKTHKADFGAILLTEGNPNEAVKLVSAKDLEQ